MHRPLYQILFFLVLFGLSFAANGRFLDEFFFRDDFTWLENAIISTQSLGNIFTLDIAHFFRPLPHLFMLGQYLVFGLEPVGYHVVSLLLHGVNAILFFYFLRDVLKVRHPFFLIGAPVLWVTHFVHYEAVAWISAQADVILMSLFMLAFLALSKKRPIAFLIVYVLALLTKETAIALFPLLFIYQWVIQAKPIKAVLKSWEVATAGVLWLVYGIAQMKLQASAPMVSDGAVSMDLSVVTALMERLAMLFGDFQPPIYMLLTSVVLLLIGGSYLFLRMRENFKKPFLFLIAFLLLTILPTALVVTPIPASRYFYLPNVAATAMILLLLLEMFQAKHIYRWLAVTCLSVLVAGHLFVSVQTEKAIQDVSEPGREFLEEMSDYIEKNSHATFNFVNPPFTWAHAMSMMKIYFDIPHEQVLFNEETKEEYVNFSWN